MATGPTPSSNPGYDSILNVQLSSNFSSSHLSIHTSFTIMLQFPTGTIHKEFSCSTISRDVLNYISNTPYINLPSLKNIPETKAFISLIIQNYSTLNPTTPAALPSSRIEQTSPPAPSPKAEQTPPQTSPPQAEQPPPEPNPTKDIPSREEKSRDSDVEMRSSQSKNSIPLENLPKPNTSVLTSKETQIPGVKGTPSNIQNTLHQPDAQKLNSPTNSQKNSSKQEQPSANFYKAPDSENQEPIDISKLQSPTTFPKTPVQNSLEAIVIPKSLQNFMIKDVLITSFILSKTYQGSTDNQTPASLIKSIANLTNLEQKISDLEAHPNTYEAEIIIEEISNQTLAEESKLSENSKIPSSITQISGSFQEKIENLKLRIEAILTKAITSLESKRAILLNRIEQLNESSLNNSKQLQHIKSPSLNKEAHAESKQELQPKNIETKTPEIKAQPIKTSARVTQNNPIAEKKPEAEKSQDVSKPEKIQIRNKKKLKSLLNINKKEKKHLSGIIELIYPLRSKKVLSKDHSDLEEQEEDQTEEEKLLESQLRQDIFSHPVCLILERQTVLGDNFQLGYQDELPAKVLRIGSFCIAKNPVTHEQYAAFLNFGLIQQEIKILEDGSVTDLDGKLLCITHKKNNRSLLHIHEYQGKVSFHINEGFENYPMVFVTYYGAKAYADSFGFDLPSEAERETAAGVEIPKINEEIIKYKYGVASNFITLKKANFHSNNDIEPKLLPIEFYNGKNFIQIGDEILQTQDSSSPYGLYDMSGNVYDWTESMQEDKFILKGGSFMDPIENCRVAYRKFTNPETCFPDVGFRIALRNLDE